jgi:hypothetical protein
MEEDFYTNENLRKQLLEFLERTFDYDGTMYLLAVSARKMGINETAMESHWKLRVALTYKEGDTVNPYSDGTDLNIALSEDSLRLLDEAALADEPPIIEGSPNALALEWVSAIAPPLWVSDEAREAAAAEAGDKATRGEERGANSHTEDPFAHYFGK